MIAMQVLAVPIQLIGGAVSQVYLAHAPAAVQEKLLLITLQIYWKIYLNMV